ncbi:hypothetical protein DIPPA_23043 [Diplonema papillatum]|nr:hypothetical protein DIPPA_23043 [Diplonema papillatum]
MYLDGKLIINKGGVGDVDLSIGQHEVRVEFYMNAVGQYLKWEWKQPGQSNLVLVPASSLRPLLCYTVDEDGLCEGVTPSPPVTPAPLVGAGLLTKWYTGSFFDYPAFGVPTHPTLTGGVLLTASDLRQIGSPNRFASQSAGYLTVATKGIHTFSLTSGDSSRMYLDGKLIINKGGVGDVALSIRQHEVRVEFFMNAVGQFLKWEWKQPGQSALVGVPASSLSPLRCYSVDADGFCE